MKLPIAHDDLWSARKPRKTLDRETVRGLDAAALQSVLEGEAANAKAMGDVHVSVREDVRLALEVLESENGDRK